MGIIPIEFFGFLELLAKGGGGLLRPHTLSRFNHLLHIWGCVQLIRLVFSNLCFCCFKASRDLRGIYRWILQNFGQLDGVMTPLRT